MIIRSQDKHGFINLENIDTVCMNDEFDIYVFCGTSKSFIGEYSTEEKAIKVLDMICEAYARCESAKELASGILLEAAKRFTQNEAEEFKKDHRGNFVFQMPQDSEV